MTRVLITLAMITVTSVAWTLARAPTQSGGSAVPMRPGVGYYTETQAERGRVAFERECIDCHTVDADRPVRLQTGGGGNLASGFRAIAEKRYNNRPLYPSVYYYWRRIDLSEPGDNVDRVSVTDKIDILAYLLQQNGFPPGPDELVADARAMKGMYLDPGPDFEWLLNGRDLSGWRFLRGPACEPEPEGCGQTNPWPEHWVESGEMVARGKAHTLVYTERTFRDYTLQLEQRFDSPWPDNPDLFPANSGVIIYMSNVRLWPEQYVLVDGRWYDFMNIQSPGLNLEKTFDDDARRRAIRAPNEWQDIEIVARNGGIKAYLNGVLVSSLPEGSIPGPTRLGFQSQVIPTRWRHIRIKED